MPQNQSNWSHTRAHSGSHNLHHTRGPYQSNTTPFSAQNDPQAPCFPSETPTTTTSRCQNDPFEFDSSGGIPYWDDSNGIIYEVPSIPPRHPGRTYAQVVGGGACTHHGDEARGEPERLRPVRRDFESRRGEGSQYSLPQNGRTQNVGSSESGKRDFLPLLDPIDSHYADGLGEITSNSQTSLSRLVRNQKLYQETKEETRTAKSKCDTLKNETNPSFAQQAKFQQQPIQKIRQQAVFEIPRTAAMSTLVKEPNPLRGFKKKNLGPTSDRSPSSPTLERVRKLREVEQKATLAEPVEQLKSEGTTEQNYNDYKADVIANDPASSQSKTDEDTNFSGKANELIPDMDLSDSDWAAPLYDMVNPPPVPAKSAKRNLELEQRRTSMRAKVHLVDDSDHGDDKETDALVQAMADMRVFQEVSSTPPKHRSFQRESAVPEGLDFEKIQTAKDQLRGNSTPTHVTGSEDAKSEANDEAQSEGVKPLKYDVKASVESFETAESDDFERVGLSVADGTEHNGARRRWYKGFRR